MCARAFDIRAEGEGRCCRDAARRPPSAGRERGWATAGRTTPSTSQDPLPPPRPPARYCRLGLRGGETLPPSVVIVANSLPLSPSSPSEQSPLPQQTPSLFGPLRFLARLNPPGLRTIIFFMLQQASGKLQNIKTPCVPFLSSKIPKCCDFRTQNPLCLGLFVLTPCVAIFNVRNPKCGVVPFIKGERY
jgi:hypothetical protein